MLDCLIINKRSIFRSNIMKTSVILLSLIFAYGIIGTESMTNVERNFIQHGLQYDYNSPFFKEVIRNFNKCIKWMNPDEKTLKYVRTMAEGHDDDKKVTCFYACMLTRSGLMKDARFNFARLAELLKAGKDSDDKNIDGFIRVVMRCQQYAENTGHECVVTRNYLKCLRLTWYASS